MRRGIVLLGGLIAGAGIFTLPGNGMAQTRPLSEAECRGLRDRLSEHARLSDGVRQFLASKVGTLPAAPAVPAGPPAPAGGRAEAIRARLAAIPTERQRLEDERMGSYVRLELGRATQIGQQIQAIDTEKAALERELAALPAAPAGVPPAQALPAPAPAPPPGAHRIACQDVPATLDGAVRIRQRELGAKEGQPGALPLAALRGQTPDQIAQELAAQFAPWPATAAQVGLLDQDGNGRLDAFVDAPAPSTFRVYRPRGDGTIAVDVFVVLGRPGDLPYGEMVRRIEETAIRQTGRAFPDLLASRPASPLRVFGETGDFATAQAAFLAGNLAEAAKVDGGGARSAEFQNIRGETLRVLEIIAPAAGGVVLRRVVAAPRPNNEELWEETTMFVRPTSFWHTDVEVRAATERRSTTGALLAPRSAANPVTFGLDR